MIDTDEPIQNLTLSNNKVPENSPVGAQIGTLDAYDPDIHLPTGMKFTLVDQEYPSFALRGVNNETLVVNGSLNFEENPDYVVTIRVTDTAGRHLQKTFSIKVIGECLKVFACVDSFILSEVSSWSDRE